MKSASITKNKTHYWIVSQSKTKDGVWIATLPFIKLDLGVSPNELIEKLFIALNCSKQNVPHPKDWKAFDNFFLNSLETKSFKDFYKNALLCEVSENENIISCLPTKNVGGKGRFDHLPELEVKVSAEASSEEIYHTLDVAFSKCG